MVNVAGAAAWCVLVVGVVAAGEADGPDAMSDGELFYAVCSRCHDIGHDPQAIRAAIAPRSRKGWVIMVEQMRQYALETTNEFPKAQAERIVDYLVRVSEQPEGELDIPLPAPAPPAAAVVAVASPASPAASSGPPRPGRPEAPNAPAVAGRRAEEPAPAAASAPAAARKRPLWRPPGAATRPARWAGYVAVALAAGLLGTGVARRRLRRLFRPMHAAMALGLFACIAFHTVVFVLEYGTPRLLWLWFGVGSLGIFIATQASGLFRLRLRRGFLRLHVAGALAGAVLTVLHWVWIYV